MHYEHYNQIANCRGAAGFDRRSHDVGAFANRFSPKRYTQHQLFACLTLKVFFKTDYRGIVQLLRDLSDLRRVLRLTHIPHFTTLQKASVRLLRRPRARRLLHATVRRFLGRRRRVRRRCL